MTGVAANSLDAQGRFLLPSPVQTNDSVISEQRARELAAGYLRSWGPASRRFWESDRGGPIALAELRPRERVFLAETPYADFPSGFHPAFRRAFGPYYHVYTDAGAAPVLIIAVSGYNFDVGLDADGLVTLPYLQGMEFVSRGIPLRARPSTSVPLTPEEAVVRAGKATGARITEVPVLIQTGMPRGPLGAVWRLRLDRPVSVRLKTSGLSVIATELYAGPDYGAELLIPASEQPTSYRMLAARVSPEGEDLGTETVEVPVKLGAVTAYEAVAVPR